MTEQRIFQMRIGVNNTPIFMFNDEWCDVISINRKGFILTNTFSILNPHYAAQEKVLSFGIFSIVEEENIK